jgi:hypothetical protein
MHNNDYSGRMLRAALICFAIVAWVALFGTGVVHCQEARPTSLKAPVWVFVAGQSADFASTAYALRTGRTREGNPILAPAPLTLKATGATLLGYGLVKVGKRYPRTAKWMLVIGGVAGATTAVYNARTLAQTKGGR